MSAPPPSKPPDLSNTTILVVDDDDDSLDLMSEFLRVCGAEVLAARNTATALAYLDTQRRIDAVVSDLAMPDMSGLEFARRLRRHPTRNRIPLIAVTAYYEEHFGRPGIRRVVSKAARRWGDGGSKRPMTLRRTVDQTLDRTVDVRVE